MEANKEGKKAGIWRYMEGKEAGTGIRKGIGRRKVQLYGRE